MTYKQLIAQLREETIKTFNLYLKADEALSEEGNSTVFLDKNLIENYNKAYHKWQLTNNQYYSVLLFVSRQDIAPDSEIKSYIEVRKIKANNQQDLLHIESICDTAEKEHTYYGDNVIQIIGENLDGVISDIVMRQLGSEIP